LVGIVRSRTQTMEFSLVYCNLYLEFSNFKVENTDLLVQSKGFYDGVQHSESLDNPLSNHIQSQNYVMNVGELAIMSWCELPTWAQDQFVLLLTVADLYVECNLLQEDGSVVYNWCWASPAQSFPGPSTAGLMTVFCCLRFQNPTTRITRSSYLYPGGTEWLRYSEVQITVITTYGQSTSLCSCQEPTCDQLPILLLLKTIFRQLRVC
jgi:hypothetical protein